LRRGRGIYRDIRQLFELEISREREILGEFEILRELEILIGL
jgi:hypothetical protein